MVNNSAIAILNDFLCISVLMNFGKIKFMFLSEELKQKFDYLKRLHKYQYFLKKFLACNQISSTGLCWGELGANKIQVIDQSLGSLSVFTDDKNL